MLRPLSRRDVFAAMVIFGMVMLCTYLTLRLRVTYWNETDLILLKQEVKVLREAIENDQARLRIELNEIERTLYDMPNVTKPPTDTRRPSSVEQWQVNQYKEMSKRLTELERWRLRQRDE